MLNFGRTLLVLLVTMLCHTNAFSTHIVGGELQYEYLAPNQYKIVLNLYKDCGTSIVPFDDPASIYVYGAGNQVVDTLFLPIVTRDTLDSPFDDTCLIIPPSVCVDFARYEMTAILPSSTFGYTLAYIRCCRNVTILNAQGIDEFGEILPPDLIGATYTARIPGSPIAAVNSNPEFKEFPPIIICSGSIIDVDQSATDKDGDQLVYKLCTPFVGGSLQRVFGDPSVERPPFEAVDWVSPYGLLDIMGGDTPLQIDAVTGKLTGTAPNLIGQFVVGVCVEEYRNGILLSESKRDFQFNISECNEIFSANYEIENESFVEEVEVITQDTAFQFIRICDTNLEVQFANLVAGADSILWDFGDGSLVDTSANPLHTFPDTGRYNVILIAQPESSCADTFLQIIDLQYQEVIANMTFDEPECYNSANGLQFLDASLNGSPIANWQWDFGDGITSTLENPLGIFINEDEYEISLAVQANNGCRDTIDTIITIIKLDEYFLEDTVALCEGDQVVLELIIDEGNHAFSWEPSETLNFDTIQSPEAFPIINTMYEVEIMTTRPSGVVCNQKDSILVLPNYPIPILLDETNPIQCDSVISLSIESEVENNIEWSLNSDFSLIISEEAEFEYLQNEESIEYYVQASNEFCTSIDSIEVVQHGIFLSANDSAFCFGEEALAEVMAVSNLSDITYQWDIDGIIQNTIEPNITFETDVSVDVFLLAQNESGCEVNDTIKVTINELPDIALSASPDEVINQQLVELNTIFNDDYNYEWSSDQSIISNPFINNPNSVVDESSIISLEVVDENGCVNRDTIQINVIDILCGEPNIFIPTAFSPNGDGLNEVFRIQGEVINSLELNIFDRWGNIVFETKDLTQSWDGFIEGNASNGDVFGYQLFIVCYGGLTFLKEGSITLMK